MNKKEIKKGRHSRTLLPGISLLYVVNKIGKILHLIKDKKAGDPRLQHSGMTAFFGFTLIELLVVVLIIGILSAIALPQYQVAVKKAKLAKIMPAVSAIYEAEEAYYLANSVYTYDLSLLDLGISGCDWDESTPNIYQCGDYKVGVWDGPADAQGGDDTIRYLQFFAPISDAHLRDSTKKGTRACWYRDNVSGQVCRSLGPGTNIPYDGSSWNHYILTD